MYAMFADPTEGKEDASLDQDEPVLWTKRGPNAKPWHPGEMGAPYVYKICLLGPCHAGKSSIAHRLVAHTFEPNYRASRAPAQLFWRHTEEATGRDILIEIEDMPGVSPETSESGELSVRARDEVTQMLKPLVWFEKYRRDKDVGAKPGGGKAAYESDPLLPGGGPRPRGGSANKQTGALAGINAAVSSVASEIASMTSELRGAGPERANPIGEDRKRMGFVVVADVSVADSFVAAYAIVDRIFERLQFDVGDAITCPVSIVIVGNKSDLRGARRKVGPERELRAEIESRYDNPRNDPRHSVLYLECSAQTNSGLEAVFLQSLSRIRNLPTRLRIRTARMRATGYFAKFRMRLFAWCPLCFDLEEFCKKASRNVLRPCIRRLGLYVILCECAPLLYVWGLLSSLVKRILLFRWLCDWCPPFILRLRKEVDTEEEDAEAEREQAKKDEEAARAEMDDS